MKAWDTDYSTCSQTLIVHQKMFISINGIKFETFYINFCMHKRDKNKKRFVNTKTKQPSVWVCGCALCIECFTVFSPEYVLFVFMLSNPISKFVNVVNKHIKLVQRTYSSMWCLMCVCGTYRILFTLTTISKFILSC